MTKHSSLATTQSTLGTNTGGDPGHLAESPIAQRVKGSAEGDEPSHSRIADWNWDGVCMEVRR